jgi:NAD-reducing hydrogenase small subunit
MWRKRQKAQEGVAMSKLKVATCSLAGCFGCHMSILDLDERLFTLVDLVEFDRSPITDIKQIGACDVGIIEGGVCNAENVHVLREFRGHCNILVSMGACAITGGVPTMRNRFTLKECLDESYLSGIGLVDAQVPNDPEIPLLLSKVHPLHEVVKIDYFLPGCPPSADAIWTFLNELLSGRPIALPYTQLHYD